MPREFMRWSLVAAACYVALPAHSQTSIAAENIIDTVTFSYIDATGTTQNADVTIVRDEREVNQWYYVPSSPVLVTAKVGTEAVPVFTLLSYDYPDPTNPATILRAGMINFAARLSLPPEALAPMKTAATKVIAQRKGQAAADAIRIAALPINSASVSVYSADAKLVGAAEGTGTAPTFASQTMAFSIPLTQLGSAVYEELVTKPTGIRTAVTFKYNGITPKCGYKIIADYKQARDFYSKNEKTAARASYYGLFSANYSKETTDIRDQLEKAGALKIEVLASNECPPERLDALMVPLLKRINDQVLDVFKPPEKIDPAQAGTPSTGGYFGGAGYSVAVKSVSEIRKLNETISFEQATIIERTTVAQGFIGIGNYPETIRKQLITVVNGVQNPGTYVAFPQVPQGIERVDLEVRLQARDQNFGLNQYQFLRSSNAWKNLQTGGTPDRISFSLAGVQQAFGKQGLKDAKFLITKVVSSPQDNANSTSSVPVPDGAVALNLQNDLVGLRISPSAVPFRQLGGDFVRVQVIAKAGAKSKSYVFQALNANGVWQAPPDEFFFAPAKGATVEVSIKATHADAAKSISTTKTFVADGMIDIFLDDALRNQ